MSKTSQQTRTFDRSFSPLSKKRNEWVSSQNGFLEVHKKTWILQHWPISAPGPIPSDPPRNFVTYSGIIVSVALQGS